MRTRKTYSSLDVSATLSKEIDGLVYQTSVERTFKVAIRDLDFRPEPDYVRHEDEEIFSFTPRNQDALAELYEVFPPKEWAYTFYVYASTVMKAGETEQEAALELALVSEKGEEAFSYFDNVATEDYDYLRDLYGNAFTKAKWKTEDDVLRDWISSELTDPSSMDNPMGSGMDDALNALSDEDYSLILEYFFNRRSEYRDEGELRTDDRKMYELFKREFVAALVEKARREKESGQKDTELVGGKRPISRSMAGRSQIGTDR